MSARTTAGYLARGMALLLLLGLAVAAEAGNGLVALQASDASCPDGGTDIYVDCGNGTVTDNRTGLVWLANANCFGQLDWKEAMAVVSGLGDLPGHACHGMQPDECDCGLNDDSSPGEWRLPTMAEWKAMIATGTDTDLCQPAITNDMGNACWTPDCTESTCSFYGVQPSWYWSSSPYVSEAMHAWLADLAGAGMDLLDWGDQAYIWPVRSGQ